MESVVWRVSEFFFLSLGLGLSIFSLISPPKLTGEGFFKLIHSICLGTVILASLCFLVNNFSLSWNIYTYGAIFLCLIMSYVTASDKRTSFDLSLYCVQNILFLLLLFLFSQKVWESFFFLLTSSLMTSVVTYCMLLGHWYLVVFNLPILLLKKAVIVFGCVLVIKLIISGINASHIFYMNSKTMEDWIVFFILVFSYASVMGICNYCCHGYLFMEVIENTLHAKCYRDFLCDDFFCFLLGKSFQFISFLDMDFLFKYSLWVLLRYFLTARFKFYSSLR